MNRVFRVAVMGMVVMMAGAGLAGTGDVVRAQQDLPGKPTDPTVPTASRPGGLAPDDATAPDPFRGVMDEERRKAINDDRHKRLEEDVTKLQELTNELKTDVDKANKDELSLDVVRKAGEIEKLAHDVQSRMKN